MSCLAKLSVLVLVVFGQLALAAPADACAVCRNIPIYFPDGSSIEEDACLWGWPTGADDCWEFWPGIPHWSGCRIMGIGCNQSVLTDPTDPPSVELAGDVGPTGCGVVELDAPTHVVPFTVRR